MFLSGIILSGMTGVFYFRVGILIKMFAGGGRNECPKRNLFHVLIPFNFQVRWTDSIRCWTRFQTITTLVATSQALQAPQVLPAAQEPEENQDLVGGLASQAHQGCRGPRGNEVGILGCCLGIKEGISKCRSWVEKHVEGWAWQMTLVLFGQPQKSHASLNLFFFLGSCRL